ncbi:MAG: GntR family transcriptional regulator [Dethiobacteria bacterium]|nr:GntR family transcriptional regulator [Dethiobacteria bacterium]
MATLISKRSLTEQLYEKLRYDITHKEIRCGEKIDISKLKEELNISQTPIREAIIKLEQEGLVEFIPNVGARVINIAQKDVSQVFDVNSILDCGAIYLAYQSNKFEDLVSGLKSYTEAHLKMASSNPTDEYWSQAQNVHIIFYKYADNDALYRAARQIEAKADILFGEYILSEANRCCGAEEHYAIYEATKNHDYQKTVEAMQTHWENAKLRLLKWCDEHGYR